MEDGRRPVTLDDRRRLRPGAQSQERSCAVEDPESQWKPDDGQRREIADRQRDSGQPPADEDVPERPQKEVQAALPCEVVIVRASAASLMLASLGRRSREYKNTPGPAD